MTPDSAYQQSTYSPYIQSQAPAQYLMTQGGYHPTYTPYVEPTPEPTIGGEFAKGFLSGIDQTQGALYGAAGLAGDLVGWDAARDWGFENFQRNMDEASENAAAVSGFTDIRSPMDAMLWASNTIGSIIPDVGAAIVTGGAAGAGMAAAKGLGRKAIATTIGNRAKALIAQGMTTELASKQAAQEAVTSLSRIATTSAVAGSLPMEAGAQWGQDAQTYGVENTNPWRDLAFGTASASLEAFSGVGQVLRTLTGRAVSKTAEQAVQSSLKRHLATSALREGGTESVQELTSMLNFTLREDGILLTEENVSQLVDAFAAGALGGVAIGGFDRMITPKPVAPTQPLLTNESMTKEINEARGLPSITDIDTQWYTEEEARVGYVMEELQEAESQYDSEVKDINGKMLELQNFMANPEVSPEEKSNAQKQIATLAAQGAKAKENLDDIKDQTTRIVDSSRIASNKERLRVATKQKEIDKIERERSPEFTAYLYDYRQSVKNYVNEYLTQMSRARKTLETYLETYNGIYQNPNSAENQRTYALEQLSDINARLAKVNETESSLIKAKDDAIKLIANAKEGSQSELVSAFNRIVSAGAKHNATYSGLSENRLSRVDAQRNVISDLYTDAMQAQPIDIPSASRSMSNMYMGPVARPADGRVTADLQNAITQDQQLSALEQQVRLNLAPTSEQADLFDASFVQGNPNAIQQNINAQAQQASAQAQQAAAFDAEFRALGQQRQAQQATDVAAYQQRMAQQAQQAQQARYAQEMAKTRGMNTAIQQGAIVPTTGQSLPSSALPNTGYGVNTIPESAFKKPSDDIASWVAAIDADRKSKKDEDATPEQPKKQRQQAKPKTKRKKKSVAKQVQAASADQVITLEQQVSQAETQQQQTQDEDTATDTRYSIVQDMDTPSRTPSLVTEGMRNTWKNYLEQKFPVLAGKISLVDSIEGLDPTLVDSVKAVYQDGQIVIVADMVNTKEEMSRIISHEGITHYGLRAIMSPSEFDSFLGTTFNTFKDTPEWKRYIDGNPVYSTQIDSIKAEEFIAHIAEKKKLGTLLPTNPLVKLYNRVAAMVRKALRAVGLRDFSEADVVDILRASASYLANENNIGAKLSKNDGLRYALKTPDVVEETYLDRQREKDSRAINSADKLWKEFNKFIRSGSVTTDKGVPTHGTLRKWYESLADSNIRLKDIQKYKKATGGIISEKSNAYGKLELMSNKAQDAMRKVIDTFINPNNPNTVMAYVKELGKNPMFKNNEEAFAAANDYVLAVHAIERNANIKARLKGGSKFTGETDNFSGMSTKKAMEVVKMYENVPYMNEIKETVKLLNQAHLEVLRTYGLESPAKLAAWKSAYKNYVPLQEWDQTLSRIDPDGFVVKNRAGLGIGNWKASFAATGRNDLPAMPIVSSLMQIDEAIRIGEKTLVGRSFLNLVRENPDKDLWEIVPENSKKYARRIMPDGTIAFYKQGHKFVGTGIQSIVILDDNNKAVRVALHDEALAKCLRNENLLVAGPIVRGIGTLTRIMARLSTTLSIPFIISNPIRDIQTAILNLGSVIEEYALDNEGKDISAVRKQLVKDVIPAAQAIRRYNNGVAPTNEVERQWHGLVQMYKSSGAETTMYSMRDYQDTYKKLRDWSREPSAPRDMLHKVGDYLQDTSDMLENVTRLSVFKNMRDVYTKTKNADGSKKYTDDEATTKAAGVALNLTVNFTKKGAWAPVLNALYMFSGASIAGNVRMMQNLIRETSTPKQNIMRMAKFVGGTMLGAVALGAMCRASMGEDEDGINKYDKIPDYIKSTNLIIPSPFSDGGYIKIPMPLGYNLFWTAGTQMDKLFNGRTTAAKAATEIISSSFDNFSVVGSAGEGWSALIPTIFRPIFQVATNTNFAGQPIMPTRDVSTPDSQKYWGTTNVWLKKLAKGLNEVTGGTRTEAGLIDVSPETMEHIVLAYTSGVGRLMWSSFQAAQTALTPGKESKFTDIPILNKFIGQVGFEDTQRLYSEIRQEIEADTQLLSMLKKQGVRGEEYEQAKAAAKHALRVAGALKSAEKQMKKLRSLELRLHTQYGEFHPDYNRRLKDVKEARERYMIRVLRTYESTKE